mmetsp:Transcript_11810/g.27948  ORF Transcript_11810/g.27948 Transcript_11810/m.27948 type:complete len:242 (-) Transcript_11810:67-792(-)
MHRPLAIPVPCRQGPAKSYIGARRRPSQVRPEPCHVPGSAKSPVGAYRRRTAMPPEPCHHDSAMSPLAVCGCPRRSTAPVSAVRTGVSPTCHSASRPAPAAQAGCSRRARQLAPCGGARRGRATAAHLGHAVPAGCRRRARPPSPRGGARKGRRCARPSSPRGGGREGRTKAERPPPMLFRTRPRAVLDGLVHRRAASCARSTSASALGAAAPITRCSFNLVNWEFLFANSWCVFVCTGLV